MCVKPLPESMLTNYLWNLVALKIINWKYWYMYFQLAIGETTTFWKTQSESPICKMPSYLVISRWPIWNNGLWCIDTYSKSFSSNNILTKIMPNCVVSPMFTDGLASLCSYRSDMMTLSNENIFGVTGPLCGKFTGDFPSQRPVTRCFDVFFDLRLNKRLSKQSGRRWLDMPSCSLWRRCNGSAVTVVSTYWGLSWARFVNME